MSSLFSLVPFIRDLVGIDMHHLYNMQCFVHIYFSCMLQIISEIYFDYEIKSLRSIIFYLFSLIRNWLEPICITCIINMEWFAYISFLTYVKHIFWDIFWLQIQIYETKLCYLFIPIRNWLELICITCIICSVLVTFHFSLMSQMMQFYSMRECR